MLKLLLKGRANFVAERKPWNLENVSFKKERKLSQRGNFKLNREKGRFSSRSMTLCRDNTLRSKNSRSIELKF